MGPERGSGGGTVHRGIRGQEGYTRDISISQQEWWCGGGGGSPYANQRCICHREAFQVFPRQRGCDTLDTVYHQRGDWQGRR